MKHRYAITVATGLAATAAVASLGLTSTANAASNPAAVAPRTVAPAGHDAPRAIVARPTVRTVAKRESQSESRVVIDCSSMPQVRPSSYVLACADAGLGLQGLHWTSWAPSLASGYGRFYENDCTPNCASGTVTDYPVLVTLWGSATVPGLPSDQRYTRLTLTFTGQRPPAYDGPGRPTYPLSQTFETNATHV